MKRSVTIFLAAALTAISGWGFAQQVAGVQHPDAFHERCFGGVLRGQDQGASGACGVPGHSQCTAYGSQLAIQRELARQFVLREVRRPGLTRCRQNAERDGQIETTAFLRQICRSKVDGDAAAREFELAGQQGRAYPIPGFLDLGVREADQGDGRQPVRQVDFHRDLRRVHAA